MEQAQNLSPLHFDHKLGLFGDHENKENLLKISEIKDLSIFQIAKFKKSSIEIEKVTINQLNLPTESLKVSHNQETRVLWTGPDTWLIISKKIDLKDEIYIIWNTPTSSRAAPCPPCRPWPTAGTRPTRGCRRRWRTAPRWTRGATTPAR
mgnify:CR=1 FL=1